MRARWHGSRTVTVWDDSGGYQLLDRTSGEWDQTALKALGLSKRYVKGLR